MPILPKTHDVCLAEVASSQMGPFLSNVGSKDILLSLRYPKTKDSIEFFLPPAIVELFFKAVVHIASGDAVTIVPFHAELTTQEAANFLNVSRPYLIQLLEKESIPFRLVGRHRRILFEDLVKYKEKSKAKGRKAREELTREAQDLKLGY